MTEAHQERRHGYEELAEQIHILNTDLATIKVTLKDHAAFKRVLWGNAFAMVVLLASFSFGYGKLTYKIEHMNLARLEKNVATSLVVLGDHGTELKNVRDEQFRIRGVLDDMSNRFQKELSVRTDDRFRRSDWNAGVLWIKERFKNFEQRIGHLEDTHHKDKRRHEP